mmetsp:Transcript_38194/g.107920  ORF Transcript_38194/g.107920 Transcript_38194/m.107920 type:complete len:200 (-) Transcript_38194:790-1389(-)
MDQPHPDVLAAGGPLNWHLPERNIRRSPQPLHGRLCAEQRAERLLPSVLSPRQRGCLTPHHGRRLCGPQPRGYRRRGPQPGGVLHCHPGGRPHPAASLRGPAAWQQSRRARPSLPHHREPWRARLPGQRCQGLLPGHPQLPADPRDGGVASPAHRQGHRKAQLAAVGARAAPYTDAAATGDTPHTQQARHTPLRSALQA